VAALLLKTLQDSIFVSENASGNRAQESLVNYAKHSQRRHDLVKEKTPRVRKNHEKEE